MLSKGHRKIKSDKNRIKLFKYCIFTQKPHLIYVFNSIILKSLHKHFKTGWSRGPVVQSAVVTANAIDIFKTFCRHLVAPFEKTLYGIFYLLGGFSKQFNFFVSLNKNKMKQPWIFSLFCGLLCPISTTWLRVRRYDNNTGVSSLSYKLHLVFLSYGNVWSR